MAEIQKDVSGNPKEKKFFGDIKDRIDIAKKKDGGNRKKKYTIRMDFFRGNQEGYTNVFGLNKEMKKGHIQAVFNYIAKMGRKYKQQLTNNPPTVKILPDDVTVPIETVRAQTAEKFIDTVLEDNQFFKTVYDDAVLNQVVLGNAIVVVGKGDDSIDISSIDNIENSFVFWSGINRDYTGIAIESKHSLESLKKLFGWQPTREFEAVNITEGDYETPESRGDEYAIKRHGYKGGNDMEDIPGAIVTEIYTDEVYAVMIGGDPWTYNEHNYGFNPAILIHGVKIPGEKWSNGYLDDLLDPQTELNERSSEEGDVIRLGANQKYVVKNMPQFDAQSLKPGSGQVVYVQGDGADFGALRNELQTFPSQSYLERTMEHLHNLGVPKVALASGGAGYTGRAQAVQYQALLDTIDELRMEWERVLEEVVKRIQILGSKYFQGPYWLSGVDDLPTLRSVEFDWSKLLPIAESDVIVDVLNKVSIGLPLKVAFEEMGYKDPDAILELIRQESQDEDIAPVKAKLLNLLPGVIEASMKQKQVEMQLAMQQQEMVQAMQQPQPQAGLSQGGMNYEGSKPASEPVRQSYQNQERKSPVAQAGPRVTTSAGEVKKEIGG